MRGVRQPWRDMACARPGAQKLRRLGAVVPQYTLVLRLIRCVAPSLALVLILFATAATAAAAPAASRTVALRGGFVLAGDAAYTNSPVVPGTSLIGSAAGAVMMRFSTDGKVTWSQWTLYSANTWHTFSAAEDGTKTVDAEYRDANANRLELSDSIVYDPWAPAVRVRGVADKGWYGQPVNVQLTATDNANGSGVAYVSYTLSGFSQTYPGSDALLTIPSHPGGRVALTYYASDRIGNRSARARLVFYMDPVGPTTTAQAATGKPKVPLTLRYQAGDDRSPTVDVTLTITNDRGRNVATLHIGTMTSAKTWRTLSWTPLSKGKYTYTVRAVDLAGNQERKTGSATIDVKPVKKPKTN